MARDFPAPFCLVAILFGADVFVLQNLSEKQQKEPRVQPLVKVNGR